MRFVLPLVALCAFSSAPLRADMFNIAVLSGNLSGFGTLRTDGICNPCSPSSGLLDLTIDIGANSGPDAFDISDDVQILTPSFVRAPLNFLTDAGINSETGDTLRMVGDINNRVWSLTGSNGIEIGSGTYSILAVPEPSSLFLLMSIVAIVGLRCRHQRHRV